MQILCTPNTEDVEKYISNEFNVEAKTLHIVPTMILFKRRVNFYRKELESCGIHIPSFHKMKESEITKVLIKHNIYVFELTRFFDYIVYNSGYKILTKRESIVLLERIIKKNILTSYNQWLAVISEIHELFFKLSIANIPTKDLCRFASNKSWFELINLYNQYLQKLSAVKSLDYGLAIKKVLENSNFDSFEKVYLDGAFLPIQPSLSKLIDKLNIEGRKISIFIPYDVQQPSNPAFLVLRKTYEPYVPIANWKSINYEVRQHNVVEKLARNIFTDNKVFIDDHSIEFVEFETLEDEVGALVEKAVKHVQQGIARPEKIAIVTPNPMEMRPMIREFAEFYNVQFDTPERPLIYLPFGKLISLLYQIYVDDRISVFANHDHYLDEEMVSDLLHIRIIKNSENVIPVYEKIWAFFEDCTTFENWYAQIALLKRARERLDERYERHPLYYVTKEQINSFENFLLKINHLSKKIMDSKSMTFDNHVTNLINIIRSESNLVALDQKTEQRLMEIRDTVEQNNNLTIDVREFATRIQSILKDNYRENNEEPANTLKITVTGPNNVEYQEYDYIYLLRFTQSLYPEPVSFKWPMNLEIEYQILKHCTKIGGKNSNYLHRYYLDRSLYYLFIVLNATEKKLTISFSKKYDGINQSPSHYLHDICKVFNIEEDLDSNKKLEDLLRNYKLLLNATSKPVTNIQYLKNIINFSTIKENSVISIEDIAIYEYCPRRFYYEKQYPERTVYTNIFHLQNYASSCLYEEAIKILVGLFPQISIENKKLIFLSLDKILNQSKEIISDLFPFGLRYWEDIKLRTRFHIETLLKRILSVTDHKTAAISLTEQKAEKKIGGYVFCGERQLRVKYPTITHYYSISNFKDLLSFRVNDREADQKHLQHVKNTYQEILRDFCYGHIEVEKKLLSYAKKISKKQFEKNSGGHCKYCAFVQVCMEKEIYKDGVNP